MAWIPRNKTTGVEYPAIDDATRAQWEADPMLKGKYTYKKTGDAAKPVTKAAPAKEDPPKKPIGVPDPEPKL
jgi:hypothetical protein